MEAEIKPSFFFLRDFKFSFSKIHIGPPPYSPLGMTPSNLNIEWDGVLSPLPCRLIPGMSGMPRVLPSTGGHHLLSILDHNAIWKHGVDG